MNINPLLTIILFISIQPILLVLAQNVEDDTGYGTNIIDRQIHTIVDYHGQQIYIYKSLLNDTNHRIYYYVPIVFPEKKFNRNWIWTSESGGLRLNVVLGNDEIEEIVRNKIVKIGDVGISDVAPLVIDSVSAFIVRAHDEPVPGVHFFRRTHPNSKTMTIRFQCSSEDIAKQVMTRVIDGDYDIEFAFFFAGLNKNATDTFSITSNSLQNVFSKTVTDGGNTNAIYIHKEQIHKFVSSYVANVIRIIYKEDPNSKRSGLTIGFDEQLSALMQQATNNNKAEKLQLDMYHQLWSSHDFNSDRLTSKLNIQVYKLTDIADHLQVALLTRELIAVKTSGAMIRTLNTLDLIDVIQSSTVLTGEIRLYSSDRQPPFPWLFCNGSAISRIEYQLLFDVIGTKYGNGDGILTFNLPDFRGRVPLGVDASAIRVPGANYVGLSGGTAEHTLLVEELPNHQHDKGSLVLTTDGDHSHSYSDPGHVHQYSVPKPTVGDESHPWHAEWGNGFYHDWQLMDTYATQTGIQINNAGSHSHSISGQTGSVGTGQSFTLMNPFQVVNYIIYSN